MRSSVEMLNLKRELSSEQFPSSLQPTLENVRRSCRAVAQSSQCLLRIDEARAREIVDGIAVEDLKKSSHYMEVPLKFQSESAEVNFHVVLHLFNFAHGYRHPLHSLRQFGAWQTMKRGIEVLQERSSTGVITATTLVELSRTQIIEIFDIGIRGATGGTSEELQPLVEMILEVARDSGERLLEMGLPDFASFIDVHRGDPKTDQLSAAWLVHQLATCFPAFNDRREWRDGQEVLFLKKAQLAVAELYQRFNKQNPAHFHFSDIDRFTVVCDNVLPCVLRALGILIMPGELLQRIDSRQPLPAGPDEAELRAVAVTAVETMIEHGRGKFWGKEIGDFLWTLGKDPLYRNIERHATLDTCFY